MSYRFMRILVMFDLPTLTAENRRNYRKFRKGLIKNGFYMLQESVYCRMVLNQTIVKSAVDAVKKIKPDDGMAIILTVTETQFAKMEFITGEKPNEYIDTDERIVIL